MKRSIERLSVCIETIFPYQVPVEKQIRTCASMGFKAYEFWYHDMERDGRGGWIKKENAKDLDMIYQLNQELGMKLVNFTLNSPHVDHGGNLLDDKGADMAMRALDELIPVAQKLGMLQLITFVGFEVPGMSRARMLKKAAGLLRKMDRTLDGTGVQITVEPLSWPKYQGCLLPTIKDTGELLREVGGKNVKILYDFFHVQIMTGNIIATLEEYVDLIGHIHISGVPGQHEPVNGELNLPLILKKLANLGYKGYFGLEYYPLKEVIPSLKEAVEYLADVASF